jgi:uncharacterized membrane protein YesL
MGGFFDVDGKVYRFMEKITNCLIVSILWTIFSLPIITIGASSTALYYTVYKVIRNDTGHIWREFWNAFKNNFKQSTFLWIIFLLIIAFLGVDCYFSYILSDVNVTLKWMTVILLIAIVFVVMWSLYWFPYISHIEDPIKAVMKNTLIICITNLRKSLSMILAFAVCVVIMVYLPFSPVFLMVLPAAYMYFSGHILKNVFGQYWDMCEIHESN